MSGSSGIGRRRLLGGLGAVLLSPRAASAVTVRGTPDDPVLALIAEERQWRDRADAERATAEAVLFALPRNKRPKGSRNVPAFAETVRLEGEANRYLDLIGRTEAVTLGGVIAQLELVGCCAESRIMRVAIAGLRNISARGLP